MLLATPGFVAASVFLKMSCLQAADPFENGTNCAKWAHLKLKPGSERPKHVFSRSTNQRRGK